MATLNQEYKKIPSEYLTAVKNKYRLTKKRLDLKKK